MFVGEYSCTVDAKGRINFPSKLRDDLGLKFFITIGLDSKCLGVYSEDEYEKFVSKLKGLHGSKAIAVTRKVTARTFGAEPDKQGRILLPQVLREFADIEKDIVVIGAADHCEIWSKENWASFNEEMDKDAMIDLFDELGL